MRVRKLFKDILLYLLGGRLNPVIWAGDCQYFYRVTPNLSWDQHGLVTRENRLAERNVLGTCVLRLNRAGSRFTIRLVGKSFLHVAIGVAIEPTVLEVSVVSVLKEPEEHTIDNGYTYDVAAGFHCLLTPGGAHA